MKFSLIGNGKMGKEVVNIAQQRGHELVKIYDIDNLNELSADNLKVNDVIFEFTKPDAAFNNVTKCLDADVPCVCGTTGWLENLEIAKNRCADENKTLFYASNFSIGVNIMFYLNKMLAKIMNSYENYDVSITETHHIHKLDAPSGTAIEIAKQIIQQLDRKNNWALNIGDDETIAIAAKREDEVPGIHQVIYESDFDTLEIKHSSKNRQGLALGAVLAAEFIIGKKGFFTMDNLLNF